MLTTFIPKLIYTYSIVFQPFLWSKNFCNKFDCLRQLTWRFTYCYCCKKPNGQVYSI